MFEVMLAASVGIPIAAFATMTEISHKVYRSDTKYSAEEWATLWQEKRDRLATISLGLASEPADEVIEELVSILLVSGRKLKGHGGSNVWRDFDRLYRNLTLTSIAWQSRNDGVWEISANYVMKGNSQNNATLRDDVTGLRSLAELYRELDPSNAEWFEKADAFAREYAAHLLLNYRSSPTSVEPLGNEAFTSMVERQKDLNQKRQWLVLEGGRLKDPDNSLAVEGLQKAITIAEALPLAIEAKPKLAVESLTQDEQQVVKSYNTLKRYLSKEQRATAERYLDKIAVAADAAEKAETYPDDARKVVLALTTENRALATDALTDLIVTGSANTPLTRIATLEEN